MLARIPLVMVVLFAVGCSALDALKSKPEPKAFIVRNGTEAVLRKLVVEEVHGEGENFLGCEGEFKLTAGTGKFQGIAGGSPLKARTTFSEIVVNLNSGAVVESSAGLLTLPELTYTLP